MGINDYVYIIISTIMRKALLLILISFQISKAQITPDFITLLDEVSKLDSSKDIKDTKWTKMIISGKEFSLKRLPYLFPVDTETDVYSKHQSSNYN